MFIFILTTLLLCSAAVPALAASAKLTEATGTIVKVDAADNQISVKLSDGSELIFQVDGATVLLSAYDGSALKPSDLTGGMIFKAIFSAAMTKSLPPQTYLHTLIVAQSVQEDFAHSHTVGKVTTTDSMTELLSKEGDVILRLNDATDIRALAQSGHVQAKAADIKPGARIIAWYQVMALSYPGQAGPSKVLILSPENGSSARPPKSGSPVRDTVTVCVIVLSIACLGAWVVRNRKEN